MTSFAKLALALARSKGMFIVLDADAIWIAGNDLPIIKGYRRAVITPNVVEFKRLREQLGVGTGAPADKLAGLVSRALGGVAVLEKGATDIIAVDTTGEAANLEESKLDCADEEREKISETIKVDIEGGLKRCGGQGDILSGCVGTFLAWGKCYEDGLFGCAPSSLLVNRKLISLNSHDKGRIPVSRLPLLAALGGSMVTRTASRQAFFKEGRSVVTQDMIPEIGKAFTTVFREEFQD